MDHSFEFILNHPVLSVALFIFIYLIISFEIKNFTKKYKSINCTDLVTMINEKNIVVLDTRDKTDYKKGHISQAMLHDSSSTKKLDFNEVVVYDKDEISSVSSAEKILKNNSIRVLYLEGGIQSWTDNNFPLVEGK